MAFMVTMKLSLSEPKPWRPSNLDLVLSMALAIGLPLLAGLLYDVTGALIPMLIYYAAAWGIVKWRRGQTGYLNKPRKKLPVPFIVNIILVSIALAFAFIERVPNPAPDVNGVVVSAIIWPIANASTEQLLWIYIFEAWDLRFPWNGGKKASPKNWTCKVIGLLLNSIFIGMIHVLYWAKFLTTVEAKSAFGVAFILLTTVTGYMHLWTWRDSNQMLFTFIPHYLLNLLPFFWTGYSLLPFLVQL